MFKMPENVACHPFHLLEEMFYGSRPLPLPCYAIHSSAKLPTKENPDDFGWDIYPKESVTIGYDVVAVDTGLACAIPPGYGAFLKERSGLARKYGVKLEGVRLYYGPDVWEDISGGVIDAGYRGPLIALLSMREGYPPREFSPEDKVAQLVILPAPRFVPFWVNELPPSSRGGSGFGDSGGVGVVAKPKPSPSGLGASVSVPEPEACPYEAKAWEALQSVPSLPSEGSHHRCQEALRLQEECKSDRPENPVNRLGEPLVGEVTVNGVRVPILDAIYRDSGHYYRDGWAVESSRNGPFKELRESVEVGEIPGGTADMDTIHLEPFRGVNPAIPIPQLHDMERAAQVGQEKSLLERIKAWAREGVPGSSIKL